MCRIFQVALGIGFIIAMVGVADGIHEHEFKAGAVIVLVAGLVICATIFKRSSRRGTDRAAEGHPSDPVAANQIQDLEKRMADLQEIVISIDERLSRILSDSRPRSTLT